jgi:hypothetical protein
MVARAFRQCRPIYRRWDTLLGAHLLTPKPYRIMVQLVGRHAPAARYYVRLSVGRRLIDGGVIARRTRRDVFLYASLSGSVVFWRT